MSRPHRVAVTKEQWDAAAASYELGHQHAAEIARRLGVSPATVSREFQRRRCVKARRIDETVAAIEARLDAEAIERARAKAAADAERKAAIARFTEQIFDAMAAADEAGVPLGECPEIMRIDKELRLALR